MNVSVFCFLASYAVAFALEWRRLKHPQTWAWVAVLLATVAGLVAQTTYLINRASQTDLPPLLSSSHDWLLVLTWVVVLCYLVITVADRTLALGIFLLPVVLAVTLSAYLVSFDTNHVVLSAESTLSLKRWALLHAGLLVFGVAGVVVSFVLSLMFLVQHRRLKQRQTSATGLKLPSLERMARLNWWAVVISVPLLTLGMATGIVLSLADRGEDVVSVSLADPVILTHGVLWTVMFGFFLWLVSRTRPAGRQVAILTVWACGFLLLALVGLQIITGKDLLSVETWHARRDGGTRSDVPLSVVCRGGEGERGRGGVAVAFLAPHPKPTRLRGGHLQERSFRRGGASAWTAIVLSQRTHQTPAHSPSPPLPLSPSSSTTPC